MAPTGGDSCLDLRGKRPEPVRCLILRLVQAIIAGLARLGRKSARHAPTTDTQRQQDHQQPIVSAGQEHGTCDVSYQGRSQRRTEVGHLQRVGISRGEGGQQPLRGPQRRKPGGNHANPGN